MKAMKERLGGVGACFRADIHFSKRESAQASYLEILASR